LTGTPKLLYFDFEINIQNHLGPFKSMGNSLLELEPGTKAGVLCVECGKEVSSRLQELGFVPGASVEVLGSGCPMVVRVGETRLCLREEQAAGIRVLPL
jgi:Fe2+ transport system protein FeoA